jgi:sarcosine oxidase subunit alpha
MAARTGAGFRLAAGGSIDRTRPQTFRWNGRAIPAYAGDTVASALLANGVRIVGRGMKFHRPRGVLSAGIEEPNALVTLGTGAAIEPNARATMIPARDGLEVRAQNCWPGVEFDLGRAFDATAPLWPAGFYGKTFIWPSWHFYERFIRGAAGLGPAPQLPDPARYEAVNAHCDLLVVGGGPAGLLAAVAAVRAGRSVILAEQDFELGGQLLCSTARIDGRPAMDWVAQLIAEIEASTGASLLKATTVFGLYDHGNAGLLQRLDLEPPDGTIRQRYWRVRAKQTLLATGAIEQPLVFEANDLPGIMLAGAARQYANRHAVAVGRRVVFATNNDSAYVAALDLIAAGIEVPFLFDTRPTTPEALADSLRTRGVEVRARAAVVKGLGHRTLDGLRYGSLTANGSIADVREVHCDALGLSGGWSPTVHLFSHARGKLEFDPLRQCFLPRSGTAPVLCAGSVTGTTTLAETLASALAAVGATPSPALHVIEEPRVGAEVGALRRTPAGRRRRQWLDLQHDVTVADVGIAMTEGFEHVELVKRYTTAGMSVDQGRTSNLNTLLTVAGLSGRDPGDIGTTTYRPPYSPVALGALAGRQTGDRYLPRRLLPAHERHAALGAHWWETGGWMRPACYPQGGESMHDAVRREALAVRSTVGIYDASPLGKIEVTGPDAARFLDFFYINNVLTLQPGRARYGLMLNESGVIIDDGTIARLGPAHFVITTTSSGAGRITQWLEEWRQCELPHLEVFVTPVTSQWATIAASGPRSRGLLQRLGMDIAVDGASLPHLQVREGHIGQFPVRLYRISFSGELGYEINVPARHGAALWERLMAAGQDLGVVPYGIESLLLLRLEKGFLHVGVDTDGTTSPADVGWGEVAMKKKADFVGKRSLTRSDNLRADRLQLVGLTADDADILVAGAHLRLPGTREGSDGWVTSAALSPALGRPIALALLRGGRSRLGEAVFVHDLDRRCRATVVTTPFFDPEGTRLHA